MKPARTVILLAIAAVCSFIAWKKIFNPPGPRPWCQRAFAAAFEQWFMENSNTNGEGVYPNSEGRGRESIAQFGKFTKCGDMIYKDYGYVPGLRESDPKDLVLMYMKQKTRHTWHGDHSPTIFTKEKWMVLGPHIHEDNSYIKKDGKEISNPEYCPEGGRLEETAVFKERLVRTLEFLKENNRPCWETVTMEHTAFLNSIAE